MQTRILLIGHRRQLVDVFLKRQLEFFVWNDKPILDDRVASHQLFIASFSDDEDHILLQLKRIQALLGTFSHVIAGKEMAVIAVAYAQKVFQTQYKRDLTQVNMFRDKVVMKQKLLMHSVPMTDFYESLPVDYSYDVPLVFKERNSTGSRGIELINSPTQVPKSLSDHFYFEKYIDGIEGSVESFLHGGEIIFSSITKYFRKKYINVVGDHYSDELTQKILQLNQSVLTCLGLKQGMTHLEFYILPDGQVLFGEVALRPPGGHIMELIEKSYEFSPWEAYVDVEMGMRPTFLQTLQQISLAYIFHPGSGMIQSVPNKEEVKKIPGVYKCKLKVKLGQILGVRHGVGEEAGYVLASLPPETSSQMIEKLITRLDQTTLIKIYEI